MSDILIFVELSDGRYDVGDTFPVRVRPYEPLCRSIRRERPLNDYDMFYEGRRIKEHETPSSLNITTASKVEAFKLATKEEQQLMREHLKSQKMDPDKFRYYQKGDMAQFEYDPNNVTPPPPQLITKKNTTEQHKWGRGKRLGTK